MPWYVKVVEKEIRTNTYYVGADRREDVVDKLIRGEVDFVGGDPADVGEIIQIVSVEKAGNRPALMHTMDDEPAEVQNEFLEFLRNSLTPIQSADEE